MVARHVPIVRSMRRTDQGYLGLCGYSGTRRICWPTAHNVVSARLNAWRAERRSGWDVAEAVLGAGPLAMTGFARRGLSASCCTRRGFKRAGSGRENREIAAETMPGVQRLSGRRTNSRRVVRSPSWTSADFRSPEARFTGSSGTGLPLKAVICGGRDQRAVRGSVSGPARMAGRGGGAGDGPAAARLHDRFLRTRLAGRRRAGHPPPAPRAWLPSSKRRIR